MEDIAGLVPRPERVRLLGGAVAVSPGDVRVRLAADAELGPEGYRLCCDDGGVEIVAASAAGAFYGRQTLARLLPVVPCLELVDRPRFAWRGQHVDVSRHFFPLAWLKRLVDLLAFHKLNVLHLHLTDDQGWRIEIERYPRLTEVGAWRRESMAGYITERRYDGVPHGGFYTQAELRELVAYAAEWFVTVVPEIDMPGHMQAAIAAYPELGNGDAAEVWTSWGVSRRILNAEESTVAFMCDVLDEVLDIFPSRFVHVGGDECPKDEWRASARTQTLIRERGLADEEALQGWFMGRIAEHLRARGRIMVGWDEILEGGAPDGAVVMSWRGEEGGLAAARAGHDVVMAPEGLTYLDYAQTADPGEPLANRDGGVLDLATVAAYGPVPVGLEPELARHVLGAQCQLWTEYVPSPAHAEYMLFPRLCAFADVVWSRAESAVEERVARVEGHCARGHRVHEPERPEPVETG